LHLEYKNGKAYGKGKFVYVNKDVYDGEWLEDMRHGPGTYYYTAIGDKFEGRIVEMLVVLLLLSPIF
jgi:hypothetical protein